MDQPSSIGSVHRPDARDLVQVVHDRDEAEAGRLGGPGLLDDPVEQALGRRVGEGVAWAGAGRNGVACTSSARHRGPRRYVTSMAGYHAGCVLASAPGRDRRHRRPAGRSVGCSWRWAHRSLPDYLLSHSVRSYRWGAAVGLDDRPVRPAGAVGRVAHAHDVGLTRIWGSSRCFEVEGAEIAQLFPTRHGVPSATADVVARAIVLHMAPSVTVDDGVEAVLLDRATALDVRGVRVRIRRRRRPEVICAFPRRASRSPLPRRDRACSGGLPALASARLLHGRGWRNGWRGRRGRDEDRVLRASPRFRAAARRPDPPCGRGPRAPSSCGRRTAPARRGRRSAGTGGPDRRR